jgi:hypothetical protein
METFWQHYIDFLNYKTTLPMIALIISTAGSFWKSARIYADEDDIKKAILDGLKVFFGVYALLLLFKFSQRANFFSWCKYISIGCGVIGGIIFFIWILRKRFKIDPDIGAFLFFAICAGLISCFSVLGGCFLIFIGIKYIIGHGFFHGIIFFALLILLIVSFIVVIQNGEREYYSSFIYILAFELIILLSSIITKEIFSEQ